MPECLPPLQGWAIWRHVSHHGPCPSQPRRLSHGQRARHTCLDAPLSWPPFSGRGRPTGKSVGWTKGAGDRTGRVPVGPTHLFCIQTYQAYNYCDYSYKPHIWESFYGSLRIKYLYNSKCLARSFLYASRGEFSGKNASGCPALQPSPMDNPGDASDSRGLDFDLCSSKAKIKDSI